MENIVLDKNKEIHSPAKIKNKSKNGNKFYAGKAGIGESDRHVFCIAIISPKSIQQGILDGPRKGDGISKS